MIQASRRERGEPPLLKELSLPVKSLVTASLVVLALGMSGAFAQIVLHDVIPTFVRERPAEVSPQSDPGRELAEIQRGSLAAEHAIPQIDKEMTEPDRERFLWMMKWTHIHLFGMNMIFMLLGLITIMLDLSREARTLLVVLPFVGVFIDVSVMWLKAYVSPVFFWLHLPGGGLFAGIFVFVLVRALAEMWWPSARPAAPQVARKPGKP